MIYVNSKPYKILSGKYILQIEQRKLIIEEIRIRQVGGATPKNRVYK
jgi:hypothetical protein